MHNLSVGEQQRVEIVRCLLQDPSLLIMDEPTSVLTPQESEQLFDVLRRFADSGVAILFISHKLEEIRALTERATVLRRGQNVGTVDSRKKSSKQLAEMMVGSAIGEMLPGTLTRVPPVCLRFGPQPGTGIGICNTASRQFFAAVCGEVLGIAGIAGNGQDELMEALTGEWTGGNAAAIRVESQDIGTAGPARAVSLDWLCAGGTQWSCGGNDHDACG